MKTIHFAAAISAMMLLSAIAFSQNQWEEDINKDGIVVYTRSEDNSDFRSFKAITEIDAASEEIIKILQDADNYTKWFGYTNASKLLSRSGNVQYNYMETGFPWPFDNRDMVYRMEIIRMSPEKIQISLKGLPDYIPAKAGIQRMKKAEGSIFLHSNGKKTTVTYLFHSEPGGDIPARMANISISELPFRTLSGLKQVLKTK